MNPFHKGQTVVDQKTGEVLGIVQEVRFAFLIVWRGVTLDTKKHHTANVRKALASVDENDVVHINKEALR